MKPKQKVLAIARTALADFYAPLQAAGLPCWYIFTRRHGIILSGCYATAALAWKGCEAELNGKPQLVRALRAFSNRNVTTNTKGSEL